MTDEIGFVESAYDLSGTLGDWAQRMVDGIVPLTNLDLDMAAGYHWKIADCRLRIELEVGSTKARELFARGYSPSSHAEGTNASDSRDTFIGSLYLQPGPFIALRERIGDRFDDFIRSGLPSFFGDILLMRGDLPYGAGFMMAVPSRQPVNLTPRRKKRFSCLSAHMSAGHRLRQSLIELGQPPDKLLESEINEAVLSPDGKMLHATGAARSNESRDALRAAARSMDWARTRAGRADSERALEVWQGLAGGRWSLVDQFESDGRRYILALHNAPNVSEPRALTPRERQVANLAALGYSNKQAAYSLGLSESSVATYLRRAQHRLGVSGRAELVRTMAPALRRSSVDLATEAPEDVSG